MLFKNDFDTTLMSSKEGACISEGHTCHGHPMSEMTKPVHGPVRDKQLFIVSWLIWTLGVCEGKPDLHNHETDCFVH